MNVVEVSLESVVFSNNCEQFFETMKECFERLNKLIKQKNSDAPDEVIWMKKTNDHTICLGYVPNPKSRHDMFSENTFNFLEPDNEENKQIRMFLLQQVIYLGCREWGLYEQVPMSGAYEENKSCYFQFVQDGVHYLYKLWINSEKGYQLREW